jgi:hypothetical protein
VRWQLFKLYFPGVSQRDYAAAGDAAWLIFRNRIALLFGFK